MSVEQEGNYRAVLFKNVTAALKAEKLLLQARVAHKIIPVPKSISTECGVCVHFNRCDEKHLVEVLTGKIEHFEICDL